jgi:two-component system sensor histidine kinase KdpD
MATVRDGWPAWARVLLPGVGLPLVGSALALLPFRVSTTAAALVFVLAVTGAAAMEGLVAGLIASVLSFLFLNLFFTPPVGTLSVQKTGDLVALVVFLLVSVAVGSLLSRALAQQSRAERREREARLLQHLGQRLLSGDAPSTVLASFGDALVGAMAVTRYEAVLPNGELIAERGGPAPPESPQEFPMVARGNSMGSIRVYPRTDGSRLENEERHLVTAFAAQMAMALDASLLAEDARAARVDAERSQVQAALLSSVTHDLRTPLASITASVTDLMDTESRLPKEQAQGRLETIRQEAARLNRVVGNLLDLSRIRAGALTPSKRPVSVEEVIEGVVGRLESVLAGHRVRLLIRENLPDVPLDVVQIDQALTNVLENAAKFAPAGTEILIGAARWERWVQVRIADQGPGIPVELRERLLEPFTSGEDVPGAGTGLGLAIARAVVVAHGGTMRIDSAPGGGTVVIMRLPIGDPV